MNELSIAHAPSFPTEIRGPFALQYISICLRLPPEITLVMQAPSSINNPKIMLPSFLQISSHIEGVLAAAHRMYMEAIGCECGELEGEKLFSKDSILGDTAMRPFRTE